MEDKDFIKISEVILAKSGIELMPRDKNRVALAVDKRKKSQKAKSFIGLRTLFMLKNSLQLKRILMRKHIPIIFNI